MGKEVFAVFLAFLMLSGSAAALTTEQVNTLNDLAEFANVSNDTLISIFSEGDLSNYYTRSEVDLYWTLTREIIDDKIRDIGNISDLVEAEAVKHLDNYTTFIESKTEVVSQLSEITSTLKALKDEIGVEGSSEDLWTAIDELRATVGGFPEKYPTKLEVTTAISNVNTTVIKQPVQQQPEGINPWLIIIPAVLIFGVGYLYFNRGSTDLGKSMSAMTRKLSAKDRNKTLEQLEQEQEALEKEQLKQKIQELESKLPKKAKKQ